MQCDNTALHDEHDVIGDEGQEDMCIGNYEVVDAFGTWRIILSPSRDGSGWLEPVPGSGLPPYLIDSSRVHEGEPNGHTWIDQVGEKMWAKPHMRDFTTALRAAQARWP